MDKQGILELLNILRAKRRPDLPWCMRYVADTTLEESMLAYWRSLTDGTLTELHRSWPEACVFLAVIDKESLFRFMTECLQWAAVRVGERSVIRYCTEILEPPAQLRMACVRVPTILNGIDADSPQYYMLWGSQFLHYLQTASGTNPEWIRQCAEHVVRTSRDRSVFQTNRYLFIARAKERFSEDWLRGKIAALTVLLFHQES